MESGYPTRDLAWRPSTQDKVSILPPQKIAEAFILLQTSLDDKHYWIQISQILKTQKNPHLEQKY